MTLFSNLHTRITGDASDFVRATQQATNSADKMSGAFRATAAVFAAAVASVTALGYAFNKVAGDVGSLYDQTQALGLEFDKFTNLRYAAEDAGVGVQSLMRGMSMLQVNLGKAAMGSERMNDALAQLGLNIRDFAGLSLDQAYSKIAQALAQIDDKSVQAAIASVLLGRASKEQIGFIRSGVDEAVAKYEKLGYAITTAQAAALDAADEANAQAGKAFDSVLSKAFANIANSQLELAKIVQQTIEQFGGMEKAAEALGEVIRWVFESAFDFVTGILQRINLVMALIYEARAAMTQSQINGIQNKGVVANVYNTTAAGLNGWKDLVRGITQEVAGIVVTGKYQGINDPNRDYIGYSEDLRRLENSKKLVDLEKQRLEFAQKAEQYKDNAVRFSNAQDGNPFSKRNSETIMQANAEINNMTKAAAKAADNLNGLGDSTFSVLTSSLPSIDKFIDAMHKASDAADDARDFLNNLGKGDGKAALNNYAEQAYQQQALLRYDPLLAIYGSDKDKAGFKVPEFNDPTVSMDLIKAAQLIASSSEGWERYLVSAESAIKYSDTDTRDLQAAVEALRDSAKKINADPTPTVNIKVDPSPAFHVTVYNDSSNKSALYSDVGTVVDQQMTNAANGVTQ